MYYPSYSYIEEEIGHMIRLSSFMIQETKIDLIIKLGLYRKTKKNEKTNIEKINSVFSDG